MTKTGTSMDGLQPNACAAANATLTPNARRKASRRCACSAIDVAIEALRGGAVSVDIGEHADQPNPQPAERIHDRVVVGVDDNVGLRANANALGQLLADEFEAERKALRLPQPTLLAVDGRQIANLADLAARNAPANALDLGLEDLPRAHVEDHLRRIAWLEVTQVVLPHRGGDPDATDVDERHDRLADGRVLPRRDLEVGDPPVRWRDDRGIEEIEARFRERRESGPNLGI